MAFDEVPSPVNQRQTRRSGVQINECLCPQWEAEKDRNLHGKPKDYVSLISNDSWDEEQWQTNKSNRENPGRNGEAHPHMCPIHNCVIISSEENKPDFPAFLPGLPALSPDSRLHIILVTTTFLFMGLDWRSMKVSRLWTKNPGTILPSKTFFDAHPSSFHQVVFINFQSLFSLPLTSLHPSNNLRNALYLWNRCNIYPFKIENHQKLRKAFRYALS